MKVAAVVVAWKQLEVTVEAIRSLTRSRQRPDLLVCVAQEYRAADLDQLSAVLPAGSLLIAPGGNLGFAAAANLGITAAVQRGASWVLLLNNDATVSPDCLERCLREATGEPGTAVLSPAVAFTDETSRLWYAGGAHSSTFAYTRHRGLRRDSAFPRPSGDTDYVPGCCALISAAAWAELGPYREDYFMYYEDVEWCARARRSGWRVRYLGEVLCHHAVGVSSNQRGSIGLSENTAYYLARNPLRFALESDRLTDLLTRTLGVIAIWGGYNGVRIIRSRNTSVAMSYLRGLSDGWYGRMGRRPVLR